MPFPSDEQIMKTAGELVAALQALFGKHPGFRPAHAKGLLLHGSFTPTPEAGKLSTAPHFHTAHTPIKVRFSNSTGIPNIPDTDPNADPRGMALRFELGDRYHTDLILHSTPFFPTRTGAEFLAFLQAVAASPPGTPSPSPIEKFLGAHPAALAHVTAPKPCPSSFAREIYYGVNALKLIDRDGKATFVRHRIIPDLGVETLDAAALAAQGPDFLQLEITERLKVGPVSFKLVAQVAEEGDVTDDATVHWPETRRIVELGTVKIEGAVVNDAALQKYIIFDPVPRVAGLEPSDDPLLEMRAAVYLLSGKERRAAH